MMRAFKIRYIQILFLAISVTAGFTSCRKEAVQPSKTEYYLVNNTRHWFVLYYYNERRIQDSSRIPPHAKFQIYQATGVAGNRSLESLVGQRMIRLVDEHNVDWLPRISDTNKWSDLKLPAGSGTRELYFILMNPLDDEMTRIQRLGVVRLLRVSQGLAYLVVLSSVLGLFYMRLRFKSLYILVAVFLNFPVICYTADFGYFIRYSLDPWFIIPNWVLDSAQYYVQFSIPAGAMIVWALLIGRKLLQNGKN